MDDLFAPPGNDWQSVSPKLVPQRRLFLAFPALVLAAGCLTLALLDLSVVLVVVAIVLAVAILMWAWLTVGRSARSWAYAEREEDLYIRHGVMFRKLVAVPYGRMQFVDVHAGPLDQAFKIANVHLHTASPGTSAVIPGLPAEEAARLRDRLTSLGEAQAAGL